MAIFCQVLATAIICYIVVTMALLFTLPSFTLKLFSSENTTLDRIMNETEISLMSSLSSASPLIVIPFCGFLLDKLGRKRCLIVFYLPQLISWLLLLIVPNVEAFITSMFLCGLSGAIFLIIPVFVSEYCQESIRGSMIAASVLFYGIGLMISYITGGFLDYATINYLGITTSSIGLLLITFIKESPLYLMKKGLEEEAAESIGFYRSCRQNSKEVVEEVENLRRIINLDIDGLETTPEEEKLNTKEDPNEKISILRYLAKYQSSRRALVVLLITCTTCTFQGKIVFHIFANPLLESVTPNISATLASVMFGAVSVVAGFLGAYWVDTVGRPLLLILASLCTSICCMVLGTQLQFNWGPNWLNSVLVLLYTFGYTVGAGTVPFVLIGEVFMPEIKSFASMICVESIFLSSFIVLYIFIPLINLLGLGPVFYIFAGFGVITGLFSFLYIPRTEGLQVDEIQRRFLRR